MTLMQQKLLRGMDDPATHLEQINEYLDAVFGDDVGYAHIAIGIDGFINAKGRYEFGNNNWQQSSTDYPQNRDVLAKEIERLSGEGADVYVCPYILSGDTRDKETSVSRTKIHADIDGLVDLDKVQLVHGFVVGSGSPGHGHVYVPLSEPVSLEQHRTLCRALGNYLGDADAKISDNDVLRAPGAINYKSRAKGEKNGQPVTWMIRPGAEPLTPERVAEILGVDLDGEEEKHNVLQSKPKKTRSAQPVTDVPDWVMAELNKDTGDRSVDTMRIAGACVRAGLSADQCRDLIHNHRTDLDGRLQDRTDDDFDRVWERALEDNPVSLPTERKGEEDRFWESRPVLAHIRTAALANLISPWALFGCVLLRALATVPPEVMLPGPPAPASLNSIVVLLGKSGAGKSSVDKCAQRFFVWADADNDDGDERLHKAEIGSGEGISRQYMEQRKSLSGKLTEWCQTRTAVLFTADEISGLMTIGSRNGSTTISTLCTVWSGGDPSRANAKAETYIPLKEDSYRFVMWVGAQPGSCAKVFDHSEVGLPQRFLWMPSQINGEDIPEQLTEVPKPWTLTDIDWTGFTQPHLGSRYIQIPETVRHYVLAERMRALDADAPATDAHRTLKRLKVAVGLAVLDGRSHMNEQDWQLSKVVLEVSDRTEKSARDYQRKRDEETNKARAVSRGVANDITARAQEELRTARVTDRALKLISAAGQPGIKRADLRRRITSADRGAFDHILHDLLDTGRIETVETANGQGAIYRVATC